MNDLLKSRAGVVLLIFHAIGGFLLVFEHRAHIFTGNAILMALLLLCPLMHLFMRCGHERDRSARKTKKAKNDQGNNE